MRKQLPILFTCFICFSLLMMSGCALIEGTQPDLVINITDDIQFSWKEDLTTQGDDLEVYLTSSDTFDCAGMEYAYDLSVDGQVINLHIQGLRPPGNCVGDIYEAHSKLKIPITQSLYEFNIHIGPDIRNTGALRKEGEKYTFYLPEKHGISVLQSELRRIPPNLIWGEISSDQGLSAQSSWLNEHLQGLTETVQLEFGNYGHFSHQPGALIIEPPTQQANYYSFIYQLIDTETKISDVVKVFKENFGETSKIRCFTSTGRKYE